MPSRRIEQQLELLSSLRGSGPTDAALLQISKGLADRVNLIAAKAAKVAAQLEARAVIPDLLSAFERFFEDAAETDPKCWAKEALSKALKDLGYDESGAFLRGARHVQMEPVWGTEVDTAATLRSTCTLGLLQCRDLTREEKLWNVMRALTDREAGVRADAARALGELSGIEAALLLRLKARMGDEEAAVMGQVLESLLAVEGGEGVTFVAEFLGGGKEEVREEAALALGASRLGAAVGALIENWRRQPNAQMTGGILRGLSASRQERAMEFLLDLIRDGPEYEALAALRALELHRDSAEICKRIGERIELRAETRIRQQFRERFRATQAGSE